MAQQHDSKRSSLAIGALCLLVFGSAGCHWVFPFSAEDPAFDAALDSQIVQPDQAFSTEAGALVDVQIKPDVESCPSPTSGYTVQRENSNGCPNAKSCQLLDNFCLDPNDQYVVINYDPATGEMVTYGLCNADPIMGILRCMNGNGDVLKLDRAGPDSWNGSGFLGGSWRLLHRRRSPPQFMSGGCQQPQCELFAGAALQQQQTDRIHIRRVVGDVTQWFSLCKVGTESGRRRVDCAALDKDTNQLQGLTLYELKKEQFEVPSLLVGTWSIFHVHMEPVISTGGCGSSSCTLMDGFSVDPLKVYALVQASPLNHHWFQLCEGSKVNTSTPVLRCYTRYSKGKNPPYLTLDAAGTDTNMGGNVFTTNDSWDLMREP